MEPIPNLGREMMPSLKDFRSIHEEKVSALQDSSRSKKNGRKHSDAAVMLKWMIWERADSPELAAGVHQL